MSNEFSIWSIIQVVAGSIFQVFVLSLAGYFLARKNIITPQCRSSFNEANNTFFTPAFIFSKVAFSLTTDHLLKLYIVIVGFVVVTAFSAIFAYLPARLFRLRSSDRKFCVAVSMFMNSNSLPIALVSSLLGGLKDKTGFEWAAEDPKTQQIGRSVAYLVVYSTFGLILRWSYGVRLLSISTPTELGQVHNSDERLDSSTFETRGGAVARIGTQNKTSDSAGSMGRKSAELVLVTGNEGSSRFPCLPSTREKNWKALSKIFLIRFIIAPLKGLYRFMTATLYSSLLAFIVVCIPQVQTFLGGIEPLRSGLKFAGDVAVPLTLIVLGAYFHTPTKSENKIEQPSGSVEVDAQEKGFGSLELEADTPDYSFSKSDRPTVFVGIVARQVFAPAVLIPVLFFVRRALSSPTTDTSSHDDISATPSSAMTGEVIDDPCFILVMVLLIGAPPAITLAQMTSVNKFLIGSTAYVNQERQSRRFQRLISRTLLIAYTLFTPISTVVLVFVAVVIVHAGSR
ncbi:hypothetical protein CROQUDRAFT_713729 [Cronartium quercuum f. sp. fusiforme G11]|uniref:Uncharacterized protein n=1 Tax=Cronartium quercuum f. sp. fusiforme G11 TaxID=708437 RepID=A0A9P6NPT8_9BASI|nr:hypothetical protein CROQUDRAFT_713729 [Cronartium quercuum f. sp. fusiforme G11]